jgi:biopolymer transport protein ExbB/TolQ
MDSLNSAEGLLGLELVATALISTLALLAVWIPFWRGLRLALRARAATSCEFSGLEAREDSLALLLLRILQDSFQQNQAGHPAALLRDASKQYVMHEYEEAYERPLAMYANLLPPIGFIGTTLGLIVLFAAMQLSNQGMQLGALSLALTSTLFALVSFAVLEACKVALYKRLRRSMESALDGPLAETAATGNWQEA